MTRVPVSLQSLIIQCAAILLAALLFYGLATQAMVLPALWQMVLIQGGLAAILSFAVRQPSWWPPLHFLFFPSVLLALQASIPAWVYLAAFLLLVLFFWSTFRTRVPLFLSDLKAWQAVTPLLPADKPFRFIDLGSGMGGILFYLESRFPQGEFTGTEIAPAPWLISRMRAWLKRSRVKLMRRDYGAIDLSGFDVVFAFLSPAAMPDLWKQAQSQMQAGSLFVSLSFPVNSRDPDHVVTLAEGARHRLYAWRM